MTRRVDVAVIGAGVSGLAAALGAKRAGASVVVLEAAERTGGVVASERIDGFLVEHGPNSLSASPAVLSLLDELGLADSVLRPPAAARRRYVVRNGQMHALPQSPQAFLASRLLSTRGKLRVLAEPFAARTAAGAGEESLAALVRRRFGRELLDYVVDPFVSGVYAGDPERLSSRHALPMLGNLERQHGSVLVGVVRAARSRREQPVIVSLREGLQQLPRAMTTALGDAVHVGAPVQAVTHGRGGWMLSYGASGDTELIEAGSIVVALPAYALQSTRWPAAVQNLLLPLAQVEYAPVITVALGFLRKQVAHPLDGFGVLVPSREQSTILGALFSSSMFPGRAPSGNVLLTCFMGGARFHAVPTSADAAQLAVTALRPLLGITGDPTLVHATVWHRGIPQSALGHDALLAGAAALETRYPSCVLTGSYRNGVALGDCVSSGVAAGVRAAARV